MRTDLRLRRLALGCAAAALGLTLSACEEEVTGPRDELIEGQLTVDASSTTEFVYMSLATGTQVAVADPSASTDWDVAFRRYAVKLNGGVAGPGDVMGANMANNAGASDTEVAAFTEADAVAAFQAVTVADLTGASFVEDGLAEDMGGSWFSFSPVAGTLVANPTVAWKVAESGGGFALFRVAELGMAGMVPESVTLEYRHQDDGGALGPVESVEIDLTGGPGHVDFESGAVVTANGCNWDLMVSPSFAIELNDDCDAGTFPLDATADFTAVSTAGDAPAYGGFLSVLSGAFPGTIGDAGGIFWYNIEGNNRLWPTYNVFLVRVGTAVYKVQITDYYSPTGAPGFPTVRFEQLQ